MRQRPRLLQPRLEEERDLDDGGGIARSRRGKAPAADLFENAVLEGLASDSILNKTCVSYLAIGSYLEDQDDAPSWRRVMIQFLQFSQMIEPGLIARLHSILAGLDHAAYGLGIEELFGRVLIRLINRRGCAFSRLFFAAGGLSQRSLWLLPRRSAANGKQYGSEPGQTGKGESPPARRRKFQADWRSSHLSQ